MGQRETDQVVRRTFTMPADADEVIRVLRERFVRAGGELLNQSEVVRAGLAALEQATDKDLVKLSTAVQRFRPGRKGEPE